MDCAAAKLVLLAVTASLFVEGDTRRPSPWTAATKNTEISCKDARGRSVDWFIVYKLPKTKSGLKGTEMAYYDSDSVSNLWYILPNGIDNEHGNPIKNTLAPIFGHKADKEVAFVAYNDQLPPPLNKTKKGHSKGVLMAGANNKKRLVGTVWLQHSVPRFITDVKNGYKYPDNGRENGQLFLCLSFPVDTVDVIAYHLKVQAANVYQNNTAKWAHAFPTFWDILHGKILRGTKDLAVSFLRTKGNNLVLAVAKPPKWLKDVYTAEMVGRTNDSIDVQTWRNGAGGVLQSQCGTRHEVTDVTEITVDSTDGRKNRFVSREDHSKWYVARHNGLFCFSSLNRMLSQFKRGGEVTCLISRHLANLFRRSIAKRTTCGKNKAE
ncbi:cell-death-related nuclease 7-like [Haemaphysalis longicornis]